MASGPSRAPPHGGWLWVEWADGHFDSYDPQTLELADKWEHEQVEHDTGATA